MHLLLVLGLLAIISGAVLSWQTIAKNSAVGNPPAAGAEPVQPLTSGQVFAKGLQAEEKIDYKNALSYCGKALKLEPNKPEYLLAAGRTARKAGEFKQAQEWLEQLRESEGEETIALAEAQSELAHLYADQGEYGKAESLWQHSLNIREQRLGTNASEVAQSLNNLAKAYRQQGKYEEVEPLCQRALAITEQHRSKDYPTEAEIINNLALLYKLQRKYTETEPLHQRALTIREQALGKEHPAVAETLNNLGLLYKAQRKYAEAESLYQRSMTILTAAFPEGHIDIARCQENYDELKRKISEQQEQ